LLRKTALAAASILVIALTLYTDATRMAIRIMWDSAVLRPFMIAGGLYGTTTTVWSFWRFYLAMRYRPTPTVPDEQLPKISIIVPAYNEGALVGETLRRLAGADYPADRFEIIVSDDGSTDDTWRHIKRAAREISDRGRKITALHFDENRGKRWVLWEGFRRGAGDVFITVDSDSLIEPDALKAVVSPMVRDASVGAVAGNVRVLNREDGIIPRMLAVRYVLTFDYKRAAQSMMGGGGLLCCAGALAAYRRQAVLPILDQWLHQRYLGGEARAGEDHAMTNFILKQGFHVRYQRTARVNTKSPRSYANLAKMFLRWGRSNVRESVHTGSYVFSNFKRGSKLAIRYNYLHCAIGLALPYVFLTAALALTFIYPVVFGLKLLAACVMGGVFSMVFFAVRERTSEAVYAVVYSFYSMLLLGWVWPYALLTSHKSVWMTRDKPARSPRLVAEPNSSPRRRPARRVANRRRSFGRAAPARALGPLRAAS
jgi:hyaluronan synthase